MDIPWKGAAKPLPMGAFATAAARIGCDVDAIRALFAVESTGRSYQSDRSVLRRFEPHKMPKSLWSKMGFDPKGKKPWRASLSIPSRQREEMFVKAYGRWPDEALRASSWGAPQIMGFNHAAAGFETARAMVAAMAASAEAHLTAFVNLILDWKLDGPLRAHDWGTIERRYNGGGFGGKYARKMEAEYRRLSGKASPTVLRVGAQGKPVRELQAALKIEVDGRFGPETENAVLAFQDSNGLPVDGIVGKRTWAALQSQAKAKPTAQKTQIDHVVDQVADNLKTGVPTLGAGAAVLTWLTDHAPEGALNMFFYGAAGVAILAGGVLVMRMWRRAA